MNAVSDDPGGTEDSDRIDALLSTALADQARERRMLVETVFGAKSALVKAEEEIAGLRELINKRDDALLEAVAKSNEALLESVSAKLAEFQSRSKIQPARDAGLTLRIEAIEEGILQLAQRIAELSQLPGQVRRDLEISAVAIGERIGEDSSSLLADLREDQVEVVQTLARMSETTLQEVKQSLNRTEQELMERISATGRDAIEAGRSTVEQMVEHLTGYLHERDEQLYRARDQRLIDLFQQLSDTIGRSTKRKLGKVLTEKEGGQSSKPVTPAVPPAKPPPPLSIPRPLRQPAGDERESRRTGLPSRPAGFDPGPESPPPFDRPDPAYSFEQPGQGFGDRPPDRRPEPPFGRSGEPFRESQPPFGAPEHSATKAMANPLTRAELVRDYLVDTPSESFPEDPPGPPAAGGRRNLAPGINDDDPHQRKPGRGAGRSPKPPATPRGRRTA